MESNRLRVIAQGISEDAAQANADAFGWEQRLVHMESAGTYGALDVEHARSMMDDADALARTLIEQEHHAWQAVIDAECAEFDAYLAEKD